MNWWEKIKRYFTKEVPYLATKELATIFDHEHVDFDGNEFNRIEENFRIYAGDYEPVKYINSRREEVERPFMSLNMSNEVAKLLGGIIFNEECEIQIADEKSSTDIDVKFINEVLENNDFKKNFSGYLQVMLATGGLAAKPYYDAATGDFKFSWTLADTFIPLKNNTNNISEAVIPSYTQIVDGDKTYYYTLLEFHEWAEGNIYVIRNELYRSETEGKTGKKVALAELYENLQEITYYTKFSRPNFTYLKPNLFNNKDPQSPLGLSVTDNAKETLHQVNNAYDQFYWEIKQGQRKVIVSDHFLRTKTDHNGRPYQIFDDETNVYLGLPGNMDEMKYQDITQNIRAEQYITSINKFLSTLEMQVGLSTGTFYFDGQSVKTATEIVSENSMTYRTRNSHISNVTQFIKELIISLCELARETYDINGRPLYKGRIPEKEEIEVDFDDGVFVDKNAELEFYGKAATLELMPKQVVMEKLFKLSEADAAEWYKKILAEQFGLDPAEFAAKQEEEQFGAEE